MPESRPNDSSLTRAAHAPAVSIIIPAYKVAAYIRETLDSVFAQTFTDHETIVINDGSPDTDELEQALRPYLDRLVYIKQENRGAAAARNAGLRVARGRYVAFLDADDWWLENYLREQVGFIERGEGYDLVYADALITGDSPLAGRNFMAISPSRGRVTFEKLVAQDCNVITSGVLARREVILDIGLFDEELRRAHDYDLWMRLARAGARIGYQRKVLLRYRVHAGSLSGDAIQQIERELIVFEKMLTRDDLTPRERRIVEGAVERLKSHWKLEHGKLRLAHGDFAAASLEIEDANKSQRRLKLRLVLLWLRIAPRSLQRFYKLRLT
ncbi:MAG TPA: glycosyltransferase [Pyrinomonadaceae bacterium]|jgi:glycosyltransferase involved in cell wall biosynthesis|nr:glycosyltransferase [Pyrinomonadaceae bacterium]